MPETNTSERLENIGNKLFEETEDMDTAAFGSREVMEVPVNREVEPQRDVYNDIRSVGLIIAGVLAVGYVGVSLIQYLTRPKTEPKYLPIENRQEDVFEEE